MLSIWKRPSPLGELTLAAEDGALLGLWMEGQRYFGGGLGPLLPSAAATAEPVFLTASAWLDRFFARQEPGPLPPLRPGGTEFQRRVWVLLGEIPRGRTLNYGAVAALLARAGTAASPRAVGGAVGRNPIAILIPCHRVVGSDGLGGYAGGLERKKFLLALEQDSAPVPSGQGWL